MGTNRLQYRHDIHDDVQQQYTQNFSEPILTLKFEIMVKLNILVHHPLPLSPPDITAQFLPPPSITTELINKYKRYNKKAHRIYNVL